MVSRPQIDVVCEDAVLKIAVVFETADQCIHETIQEKCRKDTSVWNAVRHVKGQSNVTGKFEATLRVTPSEAGQPKNGRGNSKLNTDRFQNVPPTQIESLFQVQDNTKKVRATSMCMLDVRRQSVPTVFGTPSGAESMHPVGCPAILPLKKVSRSRTSIHPPSETQDSDRSLSEGQGTLVLWNQGDMCDKQRLRPTTNMLTKIKQVRKTFCSHGAAERLEQPWLPAIGTGGHVCIDCPNSLVDHHLGKAIDLQRGRCIELQKLFGKTVGLNMR
jgi:hypothetical protein